MIRTLTNSDFCTAAARLKCEVEAVKAVAKTETRGQAFYADGFPVILFERHKFHEFTGGKYDKTHPGISNRVAGGYGLPGQHQRDRFNEAFELNQIAAMESCSWGLFQIMGFNYKTCGFASVSSFVDAMKSGADAQLEAFVSFILANSSMARAIRNLDFATFADLYNGTEYRKNNYDGKMRTNYNAAKKEKINCGNSHPVTLVQQTVDTKPVDPSVPIDGDDTDTSNSGATEVTQTDVTTTDGGSSAQTVQVKNEQDVNVPATADAEPLYNGIGFMPTIKRDMAAVFGGNLTLGALVTGLQQLNGLPDWVNKFMIYIVISAVVAGVFYLGFRIIHYIIFKISSMHKLHLQVKANTSVISKDIKLV